MRVRAAMAAWVQREICEGRGSTSGEESLMGYRQVSLSIGPQTVPFAPSRIAFDIPASETMSPSLNALTLATGFARSVRS
jgi:hypothetical protein